MATSVSEVCYRLWFCFEGPAQVSWVYYWEW